VTLAQIASAARACGLAVRGAFHPEPEDAAPEWAGTLILLGPDEPEFWQIFTAAPEYRDGRPKPLDRWSKRVASSLAETFAGSAVFPYDGPPYAPFLRWAERSGENWPSPIGLLVHAEAGLFISFRAALAVPEWLDLPDAPENPCYTCADRPCETACPVGALGPGQAYDVPACVAHVTSPQGAACRSGCLVRQACPVSRAFGRLPEQSAFHMRAFLGE
jgi:hypothetical protein